MRWKDKVHTHCGLIKIIWRRNVSKLRSGGQRGKYISWAGIRSLTVRT
jgi:hypothetical protein